MADKQGPLVRGYNIFKGVVTAVIIVVIIILLLNGRTGSTGEPSQRVADLPTSQPTETDTPEPVIEPTLETPTIGEPEVEDDGAVKLQGQGTPGSKVEIWTGDKRLGETTVCDDGTWAYTAEIEPGDHEITARALDAVGGAVAESEPLAFTMPAPEEEIAVPTLETPEVGDDGTVKLQGQGTPGSKVEIWAGDKRLGETTVGDDGTWAYTAELEPGDHAITARALDIAGDAVAESEPLAFTMPAPEEEIAVPTLDAPEVEDDGTVKLQGKGTPGSKVEIWAGDKRLGEVTVGDDGTWTYDAELEPGEHELTIQDASNPDLVSEAVAITVPEKEESPATPSEAEEEVVCGVGEAPKGVDQGNTYIVARCEYMALIAQRTGVKLADLIAANPQVTNPDLIYPGQVLNLPPRD